MSIEPIPIRGRWGDTLSYGGPPVDQISHPIIREAVEAVFRAEKELDAARADRDGLAKKLSDAQALDADDLTNAIEAGRRRPAAKRTAAVEAEIAEAERVADAHATLLNRKYTALARAFAEHQPEWAADAHQHAERKRTEFVAALGIAIEKYGDYTEAAAVNRYAHGGFHSIEMVRRPRFVTLPNKQEVDPLAVMQAARSIGIRVERPEPASANGINPIHLRDGD